MKAVRIMVKAANALLSAAAVLFLITAGSYSAYALWDNAQVYSTADNVMSELLSLKPKPGAQEDNGASFEELLAVNGDVCAWLTLDGTRIDYPILQGEDNLSYINTDVYGSFALAGSIFLDSRCDNTFHDARIWRVTVSVSYDDNGRLTAVPTIRENESAPKADGIVFNNSYDPTFGFKELTVKKVWDDDGYKSRTTSVKIQLLHNGRVYDTVTLNACNEWTYTWPRLLFDGDNTWEINESPKPYRYRVSYTSNFTNDYETYYVTVTNTYRPGSLIQTGQLNWPIFVLGGIGIALVVIGVVRSKRGKDDNA